MSWGVLKFKLPEEREEFEAAQDGAEWKAVVWELSQRLRSRLKHEELPDQGERQALESVRDELLHLIQDAGLEL